MGCIFRDISDDLFINHVFNHLSLQDIVELCILNSEFIHLLSDDNIRKIFRAKYLRVYNFLKMNYNLPKLDYRTLLLDLQNINITRNSWNVKVTRGKARKLNKIITNMRNKKIWNVYYLIDNGYDLIHMDNSSFRVACIEGHEKIVRIMLELPIERGVDPATKNNISLIESCKHGHVEIVKMLLAIPASRGINFNQDLLKATTNKEILELLKNH